MNSIDYTKGDQLLLLEILKVMKEIRDELKNITYENQKIHGELTDMSHLAENMSRASEQMIQIAYAASDGPNTRGERRIRITKNG